VLRLALPASLVGVGPFDHDVGAFVRIHLTRSMDFTGDKQTKICPQRFGNAPVGCPLLATGDTNRALENAVQSCLD
jgi:hypothetical protein